jgi:hypothetical protein
MPSYGFRRAVADRPWALFFPRALALWVALSAAGSVLTLRRASESSR